MHFSKNTIQFLKRGVVFAFFTIFLSSPFSIIHAATVDELNEQIAKITETKRQLEEEIATYEVQIKDIGEQASTLKNTIKALDTTIKKNALDIKLIQNNIDSTQLQIKELAININKNINKINNGTEAISSLLSELNAYDNTSFIENLLLYNDLSEFWNQQQNIYIIQNQIAEKIEETIDAKVVLESTKEKTEKKKNDLLKLKSNLLDKTKVLDITKKEKNKLLADTQNSEASYKKILAEKKVLADAFDKELEMFESELKFAIDPSSIPPFQKGILSWPLASVFITSTFGPRWGRLHNGVDFRASIGTDIKAALSGIVRGTGDTDTVCRGASLGKWVFIEHGNGLSTVYAHLSLIKVTAGQTVSTGQLVGFSGNTGASTGPHLHFSVYATQGVRIMDYKSKVCKGTYTMPVSDSKGYLNPAQYLPSLLKI